MTPSSFEERFDRLWHSDTDEGGWCIPGTTSRAYKPILAFIKSELDNQRVEIEGEYKAKSEKEKTSGLYAKIARENRELRQNPPCYQKGKIGRII